MRSRSARSGLSRRALLRGAALGALVVPAGFGLAACATDYIDEPDPLRPLWLRAAADARAAAALAEGTGEQAEHARVLATVRSAHADALRTEVERLNRPLPENEPPAPEPVVNDLSEFQERLSQAREESTPLVAGVPSYRAGLLGAVIAGCATAQVLSFSSHEEPEHLPDEVAVSELDENAAAALQTALRAEHAAVWVYGLVRAFLGQDYARGLTTGERGHRARRDACERTLSGAGIRPHPAAPAYVPSEDVTDGASAARVVVTAEEDAAAAWHGVLERSEHKGVRALALDCLVGAATRGVHWRRDAGSTPVVLPLPGREHPAS